MKKVLLTGGAGYLGSVLSRKLLDKGYGVRCFDRLYFGEFPVEDLSKNKDFELVKGNILNFESFPGLLDGVDAVIHLAGLANDPTAELDPGLTRLVNYEAPCAIARTAKAKGVKRFIFASSCSVYGKSPVNTVSEDSPLNPVSIYAESKSLAEGEILKMKDDAFHPLCLRQATLYGVSPRMRFDLAINLMIMHAVAKKKIFIFGGGDQWRPFLHVEDAAEAFIHCLDQPVETVSGKIYNLGSTEDNYRIADLAHAVKKHVDGVDLDKVPDNPDRRSYRVDCERIREELAWSPRKRIEDGIKEIKEFVLQRKSEGFDNSRYYNIKTLQEFIKTPAAENGDPVRHDFLPFCRPSIGKAEEEELLDTLRSGWITTGPKVRALEEKFKEYLGCEHAVCVSSCTAALHLSLVALGIGEGDEVITTPITWPATANVVVHTGAAPVFADVDRRTLNILPGEIEKKITDRTKAIIPVHMAGQPCRMDEIRKIAQKHKLYVIEDAAHAIGASYKGKRIGTLSDMTCFSFYPIKNMTTIEGGLIATDNAEWAEKVRIYSLHGVSNDAWDRYSSRAKGHHEVIFPGFKYNMTDVQAAVGLGQLEKLDEFIERRANIAGQYTDAFSQIKGVELPASIGDVKHAHHLFIIILNPERLSLTRDEFITALKKENIGTGLHFRSLHVQPYYKDRFRFKAEDFPSANYLSERILSLPMYPAMSRRDADDVIRSVVKLTSYYGK